MKIEDIRHTIYTPVRLKMVIRGALLNALAYTSGQQSQAAKLLGLTPRALIGQMIAHGIPGARVDAAPRSKGGAAGRRVGAVGAVLVLCAVAASAQTATPSSRFALDQAAPDLATATAYTYKAYADGAATGITIVMTCTGTASPFVCRAPIGAWNPGITAGSHTVLFTASNAAGESLKSLPVTFQLVTVPATPSAPRIEP